MKAYRALDAEVERLGVSGGTTRPSTALLSVAMGDYLDFVMGDLRHAKQSGWRLSGPAAIVYVAPVGWAPSLVHVKACEDNSKVRVLSKGGKDRTPTGHRRYVQDYEVTKTRAGWKISGVESIAVASFDTYGCNS